MFSLGVLRMHVPDGIFPLWLQIIMFIISGIMLFVSVKMINRKFDNKLVPYMGVLAAVIFAAQLVNFPVPPSSGHLVGSTLLAVMLGPWAGMLIIGMVLFVQALSGDGGLLTYGLNFFNMGIFSCLVGWAIALILFKGLKRFTDEKKSVLVATSIASYIATVLAAFVLGLELFTVTGFGISALVAITLVHIFIGIGEAVLTFVILLYFVRAKPQVISFLKESEVSEMARVPLTSFPTQQAEV
ncbi:MAG: cobalamin biosynthesis protein CbiM [Candidatus Thorarchaeota archaeon]|nr:MAG: cobalamin biosynthesis protein CbiM [Candidatus Thorarchaeota archaeon]